MIYLLLFILNKIHNIHIKKKQKTVQRDRPSTFTPVYAMLYQFQIKFKILIIWINNAKC